MSANAFVYDTATGTFLYTKGNVNDKVYPASITKLYSAWVALQYLDPETVVTAGDEVKWIDPDSSRAWIYKGQRVKVKTLVAGMMLPSGNDAAYILAVAAGRAIAQDSGMDAKAALDVFIEQMNTMASDAGFTGSHFVNPDGIHDANHYMTMADLARLGVLAMDNAVIRQAVGKRAESGTLVSGEKYNWQNSNQLLNTSSKYYHADACGLKTGSTDDAGHCLLSSFPGDGGYLIIGTFGGKGQNDRYVDTLALYDFFR